MGVTIGREHFKHSATELEDRDIEGTATEVEHGNLHILVSLVHTVSQSGSSRLVHDTLYFQTGNLSGFLGCLTLRVREVCGHGDNSFCYFLAQIVLGCLLHLLQNHGAQLLGSVQTAVNVHTGSVVLATYHRIGHARGFLLHLVKGLAHETLD